MTESGTWYEIVVVGHLGVRSIEAIGEFELAESDSSRTRLRARVVDQGALHGILERIRDLGIELVDVRRLS